MSKIDTRQGRARRHRRVRLKITGTGERPRLCVFRSASHIYAQIVDDSRGHTLAAASTLDPDIRASIDGKNKSGSAELVGTELARRAVEKGIKLVAFDRGGYRYHGRVKSLADAARKGGLEF